MIVAGCDYSTKGEHWAVLDGFSIVALYVYRYGKQRDLAQRLAARSRLPETVYPSPAPKRSKSAEIAPSLFQCSTESHSKTAEYCKHAEADWIAVEGYVHHYDKQGKLAGVHRTIRQRLLFDVGDLNFTPMILAPHARKREIGLSSVAAKPEVRDHVLRLYPNLPDDLEQDFYDAIGIARACSRIVQAAPS